MMRLFTIAMITISIVASILFLYGWNHVMDVQRAARYKYLDRNEIYALFDKCRAHNFIPLAQPDENMWGFMNEKVQLIYCAKMNQYNEIVLYNAIDGKPYVFDRDQIVRAFARSENWKNEYGDGKISSEEMRRPPLAAKIEDFYANYGQQAIDEMKVKRGDLEASRAE